MTEGVIGCSCEPLTIYEKIQIVLIPIIMIEVVIIVVTMVHGGHIIW